MKNRTKAGLTNLESIIVLLASVVLLWITIPVLMVRYGFKEAGAMVVTEDDTSVKNSAIDEDLLQSRIKGLNKPFLIESGAPTKEPPTVPAKSIFNE